MEEDSKLTKNDLILFHFISFLVTFIIISAGWDNSWLFIEYHKNRLTDYGIFYTIMISITLPVAYYMLFLNILKKLK